MENERISFTIRELYGKFLVLVPPLAASSVQRSDGVGDVQETVETSEILRSDHNRIAPCVPGGRIRPLSCIRGSTLLAARSDIKRHQRVFPRMPRDLVDGTSTIT